MREDLKLFAMESIKNTTLRYSHQSTQKQCDAAFDAVLDPFEQGVGRYPNIDKANRNQCDALIMSVLVEFLCFIPSIPDSRLVYLRLSLGDIASDAQFLLRRAWNGGVAGALRGIKAELEAGDWEGVAEKMGSTLLTDKDGGDLSRIRGEEKALFLRPVTPEPETESSYLGTASSNKESFQTRVRLPNVQIPVANGIHVGASVISFWRA